MTNLMKRIVTSFLLLLILSISLFINKYFFLILLIISSFISFNEFNILIKNENFLCIRLFFDKIYLFTTRNTGNITSLKYRVIDLKSNIS